MNTFWLGALFFIVFFLVLIFFIILGNRRSLGALRPIAAFNRLRRSIGLSVEDGTRVHFSIGRGAITGPESAPALVGLSVLNRITRTTSIGDRPPVATAGDGALAILLDDNMRGAYREIGEESQYDSLSARVSGLTPFSYTAGMMSIVKDEQVSVNIALGSFGPEIGLLTEAAERRGAITLAGTDNITGQAVLYATTQEALLGEEVYAGGAYLQTSSAHLASLRAQDVMRWVLTIAILAGALAKMAGLL
ncbi:MAG: hypothetical protein OHK0052_27970 [Anaerolineales bacterium]